MGLPFIYYILLAMAMHFSPNRSIILPWYYMWYTQVAVGPDCSGKRPSSGSAYLLFSLGMKNLTLPMRCPGSLWVISQHTQRCDLCGTF